MTYEIPKNLTKYSEEFLWGLSFKNFIYVGFFLSIIALIILKLEMVSMYVRVIISIPIFFLMVLFVFAKLDQKLKDARNLKSSLRDVGYYDPQIESFINIKEVRNNSVILKNGLVLAVIKVIPINFSILSDDQKDYVLAVYRKWLKSLSYDVQFNCRSVDIDINPWIESLEKKADYDIERFDVFKDWIKKRLEDQKVRNRLFYIVIPLHTALVTKSSILDDIKSLFTGEYGTNVDEKAFTISLNTLRDRVKHCKVSLEACGLKVNRLNTNELLSVYSSYFTNTEAASKSYLTPAMWLKSMFGGDKDV